MARMLSIFSQLVFGNSNVFGGIGGKAHGKGGSGNNSPSGNWKDRSICFDLRRSDLDIDNGEVLIACYFPIEDIKGNQDELGVLKNLKDTLGSSLPSLCVLTRFDSSKYEFVFNKMTNYSAGGWLDNYQQQAAASRAEKASQNQQHLSIFDKLLRLNQDTSTGSLMSHLTAAYLAEPFEVVFRVWHAYKRTNLFRHCRSNLNHLLLNATPGGSHNNLERNFLKHGFMLSDLNKLPSEDIIEVYRGIVHMESKAVKHAGTLVLSNIRLVWIDEAMPMRNFSVPYLKNYLATSDHLELRLQRQQVTTLNLNGQGKELRQIFDQIQDLFNLYSAVPKYGPESCEECINYMSYLKPLEHYYPEAGGRTLPELSSMENFGPEVHRNKGTQQNALGSYMAVGISSNERTSGSNYTNEDNVDENEKEMNKYTVTLSKYLDDLALGGNEELFYSEDLGLMVERPANNMDLERIWRIEVN